MLTEVGSDYKTSESDKETKKFVEKNDFSSFNQESTVL